MELRVLNNLPDTPGGKRSCGGCDVCKRGDLIDNDPHNDYWPSHLVLEVTNQCNLDCVMCERRVTTPDDLMPKEVFDACVEKLVPHPLCVELSGLGEPTLAPMFPYMAKSVYDNGKILYFPTNGAGLLKPDILSALVDSDETRVSFSIDAATPGTYGKVRVDKRGRPGDWDKVVTNVVGFRKARPKARLTSCFTAGAYNVAEFPEFVKLAVEWGLNEVVFMPVRCWALPVEANSLRYQKDVTEEALFKAQETARRNDLPLRVEYPVYADGFENAGNIPGFINYLDIIPLGLLPCGSSAGGSGSGTGGTAYTTTGTGGVSGASLLASPPELVDLGFVYSSPKAKRDKGVGRAVVRTNEVMLVLSDGSVTTCGAKHVIGHVMEKSWDEIVLDPSYQSHLFARYIGKPELSKWCSTCAKMM